MALRLVLTSLPGVARIPASEVRGLAQRVEELEREIRHHRASIEEAGAIGHAPEFTRNQLVVMRAKQRADERLWRLVP